MKLAEVTGRARLPAYERLPRYSEWFPIAARALYGVLKAADQGGRS